MLGGGRRSCKMLGGGRGSCKMLGGGRGSCKMLGGGSGSCKMLGSGRLFSSSKLVKNQVRVNEYVGILKLFLKYKAI